MTATTMLTIEINRVRGLQTMHETAQIILWGLQDHVDMILHLGEKV